MINELYKESIRQHQPRLLIREKSVEVNGRSASSFPGLISKLIHVNAMQKPNNATDVKLQSSVKRPKLFTTCPARSPNKLSTSNAVAQEKRAAITLRKGIKTLNVASLKNLLRIIEQG